MKNQTTSTTARRKAVVDLPPSLSRACGRRGRDFRLAAAIVVPLLQDLHQKLLWWQRFARDIMRHVRL